MHIGLDDTDSTRRGCTTYVTALLVEKLEKLNATFLDYPNLVRLNPNVPWKTRGNGALCLRVKHASGLEDRIKETAIGLVEEHSDFGFRGTNPGIVFFQSEKIPEAIRAFAENAITGIVTLKEATGLIEKFGGEALGFKNRRGIIGALAAVGPFFSASEAKPPRWLRKLSESLSRWNLWNGGWFFARIRAQTRILSRLRH
jgi:tRNA(Ile2)-agmatinylcytidine synthase